MTSAPSRLTKLLLLMEKSDVWVLQCLEELFAAWFLCVPLLHFLMSNRLYLVEDYTTFKRERGKESERGAQVYVCMHAHRHACMCECVCVRINMWACVCKCVWMCACTCNDTKDKQGKGLTPCLSETGSVLVRLTMRMPSSTLVMAGGMVAPLRTRKLCRLWTYSTILSVTSNWDTGSTRSWLTQQNATIWLMSPNLTIHFAQDTMNCW